MVALYASVGPELTHYDLDIEAGTLQKKGSVKVSADIQYVWPHANKQFFYVGSSDTLPSSVVPGGRLGTEHHLTAFRITADGSLSQHGEAVRLPQRPVHLSTDIPSRHALVAFNRPAALRVYAINADGTPGAEVPQSQAPDCGVFAHQVRVSPDNRLAILVTRGNSAAQGKAEDPGALKVFKWGDGQLTDCASIAPNGGLGFGPRHLDFHPTKPWAFVSIERQNQMMGFLKRGDALDPLPFTTQSTLAEKPRASQLAGGVHVHPRGHVVYGANRVQVPAKDTVPEHTENNLVVYKIDQTSGALTPIQHVDTRGIHPRTFHIDPSGRMLVVANLQPQNEQQDGAVRFVPASLALFRIAEDGKLDYVRKYDLDVGNQTLFWVGMA